MTGRHPNTVEITRDDDISARADCIVGVSASKACAQLNPQLKAHIQSGGCLKFVLRVNSQRYEFLGRGSGRLLLSDPVELVLRRSFFASPRTAAVGCDSSAANVPRSIISELKNPDAVGELSIIPIRGAKNVREEYSWFLPDWYPG